jgi:transposase
MGKHDMDKRTAVRQLALNNVSTAAISQQLHVSRKFVNTWKGRPNSTRLRSGGRRLKLDKKSLNLAARKLKSRSKPGLRNVADQFGVCHQTLADGLHRSGWSAKHPTPKPDLTDAQRAQRRSFALSQKERDWGTVMFEDEKTFCVGRHPNRHNDYVWVRDDEDPPIEPTVAHAAKLQVAAGIMLGGRTDLAVFKDNMNAAKFVEVMEDTILPGAQEHFGDAPWTLMMDGHRVHHSATAHAYFATVGVQHLEKGEWPARSPDFNPIENVWSMVVTELNKVNIRNLHDLERELKAVWERLPQEHIDNAINSMPERLRLARKSKGASTRY